uniref:Venom S1 protease 25 n=1 Tax=Platymeris rhadamanthus TaxID=1134088 RepID=A0A6B9KZD7_PLARH|nr:venom S1 protease 25 [Platymeris rhadamanthus]
MLVLFVFIGVGSAINLNIASDGKNVFLKPKTGNGLVETQWILKAAKGCKLVMGCVFKTQSCKSAKLIIDVGGTFSQHCPEESMTVFNTSTKDIMSVTIENVGPNMAAYCHVKATKSYIDQPEIPIDSSEHGLITRAKKKTSCRCGWSNKSPKRIVGGNEAGINEYPFIVLLMETKTRFPFCGGSIITTRHVLTAAHCTYPNRDVDLSVLVGEHDIRTFKETPATKVIDVEKKLDHPDYNNITQIHDISLLLLKENIPLSDFVGPVCMPSAQQNLLNEYIKVMGWGLTKDEEEGGKASPVLRKVNVRIIDVDICKTIYGIDTTQIRQICTYNNAKDSCQGDSGGPLVRLNPQTNMFEQVAVVSFGRKCASTDPGVNSNVAFYMDWIKKVIKTTKNVELCN